MGGPNFTGQGPLTIDTGGSEVRGTGGTLLTIAGPTSTPWLLNLRNESPEPDQNWALAVYNSGELVIQDRTADRMVMAFGPDGDVGVGTAGPQVKLHVLGDAIRLEAGGKFIELRTTGPTAVDLQSSAPAPLALNYGGPDIWMTVDTGNVGVGTNSPQAKLHVNGEARANNNVKVWESGWFEISALQELTKYHNLAAIPKF